MLSQRLEDSRDPAERYLEEERERLLEAEGCRDLIVEIFRLAVRDTVKERSRRARAAMQFMRSPWAAKLADLIGLDSTALAREAVRLQSQRRPGTERRRRDLPR